MTDTPNTINSQIERRRALLKDAERVRTELIKSLGSVVGEFVEVKGYTAFALFSTPHSDKNRPQRTSVPVGPSSEAPQLHSSQGRVVNLSADGKIEIASNTELQTPPERFSPIGYTFPLSGLVSVDIVDQAQL